MERFKSVLVEGKGNPLQTMAAYIDLNPVRAGLVGDPKDYRFCGYAEAVAGNRLAKAGLVRVWAAHADGSARSRRCVVEALQAHRELIFGKRAADAGLPEMSREKTHSCRRRRCCAAGCATSRMGRFWAAVSSCGAMPQPGRREGAASSLRSRTGCGGPIGRGWRPFTV